MLSVLILLFNNLNLFAVLEAASICIVCINVHFNIEVISYSYLNIKELCRLDAFNKNIYIIAVLDAVSLRIFGRKVDMAVCNNYAFLEINTTLRTYKHKLFTACNIENTPQVLPSVKIKLLCACKIFAMSRSACKIQPRGEDKLSE